MNLERLSALVSTLRMLVLQLRQEIGEGPRPETKPAEDAARKSDQRQHA